MWRAVGAWSSTCPSHTTESAAAATCSRTVCYRIPRTLTPPCGSLRSAKLTANQKISFLPAIMTTSSRMQGEFLRLLFLQAHRETAAHFHATGLPSQKNRSDNAFRFKRAAFYMGLKSKVGLVAAKASALQINLNIQVCSVVAPPLHAPSHAPLLLPLLLSHNIPLPRVH
jgi:hypothetical protein